jgi:hypothetical protein
MTPDERKQFEHVKQMLEMLVQQQVAQEWYSVEEFAAAEKRSKFSVRQWCNLGRINACKSQGRCGPELEWVISHEERLRYRRHGLLPIDPKRNRPDRAA